jgi:hypothetical protein
MADVEHQAATSGMSFMMAEDGLKYTVNLHYNDTGHTIILFLAISFACRLFFNVK